MLHDLVAGQHARLGDGQARVRRQLGQLRVAERRRHRPRRADLIDELQDVRIALGLAGRAGARAAERALVRRLHAFVLVLQVLELLGVRLLQRVDVLRIFLFLEVRQRVQILGHLDLGRLVLHVPLFVRQERQVARLAEAHQLRVDEALLRDRRPVRREQPRDERRAEDAGVQHDGDDDRPGAERIASALLCHRSLHLYFNGSVTRPIFSPPARDSIAITLTTSP